MPAGSGIHRNGGYALFGSDKRRVCGQGFDMRADDAVTRCAVEVLRRLGVRFRRCRACPSSQSARPCWRWSLTTLRSCWR
jgi:hypothetical protein